MSGETDPIRFEVLGHRFEASAFHGTRGRIWWALCDETGDSSGMEIGPLGSALPAGLTVNGEEYEFQPVPNKGDTPGFKPFNKTRRLQAEASFAGHRIRIHCRITAKKNKMWNLWFQARRVIRTGSKLKPADPGPARGSGLIITVHEVDPEKN
jgi:hypothetical protein